MEKNYNYNYENRSQGQKLPVGYSNLGVSSCTSKVLKKNPVINGSLWHTTDTNEFYYDWNGERTKLNLTGDSTTVLAEIAKIKADVAKLNPDAIESKINAATSKAQEAVNDAKAAVDRVNGIEGSVNDAITAANNAVDAAKAAAETANTAAAGIDDKIAGKADVSKVDALEGTLGNKADVDTVNTLSGKVDGLETALKDKVNASDVESAINTAVAGKADADVVNTLSGKVDGLESTLTEKANSADVESAINTAVAGKADANAVKALETAVAEKVSQDAFNGLKNTVDAIKIPEVPTKVSAFTNDSGYITRLDIEGDLLSPEDKAALEVIKDLGASDVETGTFPSGQDVENTTAPSDGLTTVQDVINYVNAFFEKKKDELGPVESGTPYLYTNGYKLGDTPIKLTDPLNRYEIVLNENGEFEIELLHKNEEDGWFDIDDPSGNYYGKYFKVTVPNGYTVKTYLWDESANPPTYKSDDTSVTDPAYSLIAKDVTPDNTTYYYKDVVEGFLFSGAKQAIEDDIQQNYSGHLIKLVLKK